MQRSSAGWADRVRGDSRWRRISLGIALPVVAAIATLLVLWSASPGPVFAAPGAGVIIVGGDRDYPPYEFIDKYGHPAGFNVDLTKAIAEVMGMKVEFRLGGWSEMLDALKAGKVDILEGMSYSADRAKWVDFSPPHSIVSHALFGRRDSPPISSLEQLRGKKVIVHRSGIMNEYLAAHGFARNLVLTDTPADALRLLASGQDDYAVVAILPATYIIRENRLSNLVPVLNNVAIQRYGYAVRKGNAELLARFSEGLAILKKTGQFDAIHNKWLGVLEPQKFPWKMLLKYGAIVVVPLLLVLGSTVFWSRSLQRQVAQRTESLAKAVDELQLNQQQLLQADKMAALGILVSGVAHEINNPNGLILLDIPILRSAYADAVPILEERFREEGDFMLGGISYSRMRDEIPKILDEMQEGAKRIKRIVSDLKDFARRDDATGKERLELNDIVRTAIRLVEPSIRKATAHFTAEYAESLPSIVGNAQRIEQVIVNLIINACQALPDRERRIVVSTTFAPDSGTAIFRVRDEGVGIAPEHLSRLTDPFFTTKRDSGGTGLGLSVSAGIVKEHGGSLVFESQPGKGTVVTLTLPVIMEGNAV